MSGSQKQYDVAYVGQSLSEEELDSVCLTPGELSACRGEIGDFTLKLKKNGRETAGEVRAKNVVINPSYEEELPVEEACSLFEDYSALLEEKDDPLIIVQDYPRLSAAVMSKKGLKAALAAREEAPEREIYYFHKSIRFADENDELYEEARRQEIIFLKHDLGEMEIEETGEVCYQREDIELELSGDLLMAPQLNPASSVEKLANLFNIEQDERGFLQKENVYLQPTLSGKRGVYVLGGARSPNALTYRQEEEAYTLAEVKRNLQGVEEIDEEEREIDDQKCVVCYTCQRVCPHGAVQRDEELNSMTIMNLACQGCNLCISRCPAGAISRSGEEEIEAVEGTEVLICENSAAIAREKAEEKYEADPLEEFAVDEVPCVSTVKREDIFKRLSAGDGDVLVLGCISEACKHLTGHDRCEQVIEKAREDMDSLGLDTDRLHYYRLSPRMAEDLNAFLQDWKGETS